MKHRLMRPALLPALLLGSLLLSGCTADTKDMPLPGERQSILQLQTKLEPENTTLDAQGFIAPTAWSNEYWPQTGGYPNHAMQNLNLNEGALTQIWSARIGKGTQKALPLTAQPIVVDGRIYTLDTNSRLTAFSIKDGKKLWDVNVRDKDEKDPVIGGGIAYSKGQLYVTSGYDEALSLSPATGDIIWRVQIPAPSRAAPTIMDDRLFISTLDNRLIALDTATGTSLWEYAGLSEGAGLVGAASPAASREIVIPAFSSGELSALRVENGTVAWSENLSALQNLGGLSDIADIRGLPVIDKGLVIAVSFGGKMVAIDERTGARVWQRDVGSANTPWVAGNHIFVMSTDDEIVAMGRDTGGIRWVRPLPQYGRPDKKKDPLFWTGPVLAGGRLIVAGSNGDVLELSPNDGKLIRQFSVDKAITIDPVVAGGVLYLLTEDGKLLAYK